MGAKLHVRVRVGSGTVAGEANDKFEVEKNDVVIDDYTIPELLYIPDTSKMHFDGVSFTTDIDIDDLTEAQIRAIANNVDTQVTILYDNL